VGNLSASTSGLDNFDNLAQFAFVGGLLRFTRPGGLCLLLSPPVGVAGTPVYPRRACVWCIRQRNNVDRRLCPRCGALLVLLSRAAKHAQQRTLRGRCSGRRCGGRTSSSAAELARDVSGGAADAAADVDHRLRAFHTCPLEGVLNHVHLPDPPPTPRPPGPQPPCVSVAVLRIRHRRTPKMTAGGSSGLAAPPLTSTGNGAPSLRSMSCHGRW